MGIFKLNGINYMGGGGGGNANEQTLTWAEYCALTEEEKTNGTTYYITDINGDGQSFQPIIYSTEEREIGVWADGKPLYQKTLYIASAVDETYIDITSLSVDKLVLGQGSAYNPSNVQIPISYAHYASTNNITFFLSTTKLEFRVGSGNSPITDVYITIQYTKTTDQPGSGTWTPQGIPAVHYSTEEQVVGTWTDGSTIYEKVITGTLGNTSQKTIDLSSEINCNLIIDIKGWIMSTDSSNNYQIWMHDAYVRYYLVGNNLTINKNGADNYGWDNPYTFIIRYTKTT